VPGIYKLEVTAELLGTVDEDARTSHMVTIPPLCV